MKEDVRGRDLGDKIFCKLQSCEAFRRKEGAYAPFRAYIQDELIKGVKFELGQMYTMVGIMRENLLETWHVTINHDTTTTLIQTGLSVNLPSCASAAFKTINSEYETSPWALAAMFVSQLAADVIPSSAMLHLKYGLLLSLATRCRGGVPVGVVAVGEETRLAQMLMDKAALLTERVVTASSEFLGGLVKFDPCLNLIWKEAGDFILASGGVCLLGDWSKYKRHIPRGIDSLETGLVVMETKLNSLPPMGTPLRACVWTYYGHVTSSHQDILQLRTLIDMFGMPFLCTETDRSEYDAVVTAIISGKSKPAIPFAELKEVVNIATAFDVQLTPAASDLIKDYFVASRRERPHCLPQTAIKTITGLSEAHARLSLRKVVIPADVALVIFLYQQATVKLFGASQLAAFTPAVRNDDESAYAYMHRQMEQFSEWLEGFLINNLN